MTDNEIVKAMEICTHEHLGCEDGCPFIEECGEDLRALEKAVLGLIKNQKAEIEQKDLEIKILIRKKESLRDEVAELTAEVERLKNIYPCKVKVGNLCEVWANSLDDYDKFIGGVSEEGIKEFAEKLKEYFPSIAKAIDHTAEELIGGDNNG